MWSSSLFSGVIKMELPFGPKPKGNRLKMCNGSAGLNGCINKDNHDRLSGDGIFSADLLHRRECLCSDGL